MILCIINIYAWIPNDRAFIFKNVLNYSTVPVDPKISGHFKIPKPDGMVDAFLFHQTSFQHLRGRLISSLWAHSLPAKCTL
jgi:hypothetical protein